MKFTLQHLVHPVTLSWNPSAEIEASRLELIRQLRALKVVVDDEFDADPEFSEVTWINERIAGLERCAGVNARSQEALPLVEEIYRICGIQEELDQVTYADARPIIGNLTWIAANCLVREKGT